MQTTGKAPSVRAMENRIAALETQLTELLARCSEQRTKIDVLQVERMQVDAKLTEAAAFLDGLADRLPRGIWEPHQLHDAAADCRAMAAKLRGET
jgi:hypothetical protein